MAQEKKTGISIRRSDKNADLFNLAEEMGKSEADFLIDAGRAILEMVQTGSDEVPAIVKLARVMRANGLSFAKKATPAARMGLALAGV